MIVVIEKDTYAGDGDVQSSGYTVSNVYGPFETREAARAFIDRQPVLYSVEYDIERVTAA